MKKRERIGGLVEKWRVESSGSAPLDPCYTGFFQRFNEQAYYEAHDVLEHLWLRCEDDNRPFFQGLIQIAGAFVHLQKQFRRPEHPKDASRLRPAARLFRLGLAKLAPFGPRHLHLDIASLCQMCERLAAAIAASDFQKNPWHPERAPRVELEF